MSMEALEAVMRLMPGGPVRHAADALVVAVKADPKSADLAAFVTEIPVSALVADAKARRPSVALAGWLAAWASRPGAASCVAEIEELANRIHANAKAVDKAITPALGLFSLFM